MRAEGSRHSAVRVHAIFAPESAERCTFCVLFYLNTSQLLQLPQDAEPAVRCRNGAYLLLYFFHFFYFFYFFYLFYLFFSFSTCMGLLPEVVDQHDVGVERLLVNQEGLLIW